MNQSQVLKDQTIKNLLTTIFNLEFDLFTPLYKTVLTELILNNKSVKEISAITQLSPNRTKVVIENAQRILLNRILKANEKYSAISQTEKELVKHKELAKKLTEKLEAKKSVPKKLKQQLILPIKDAGFSGRLRNILMNADINTIGDAINIGKLKFSRLRNNGKKSMEELEEYLKTNNLNWDMKYDYL